MIVDVRPRPVSAPSGKVICGKLRDAGDGRQVACKVAASWRVGLRLMADRNSEPFDYFFEQLKVCNHCRMKLTVEEIQTDATFTHVSRKMLGWHRPPPKRRLTKLVFESLRDGSRSSG